VVGGLADADLVSFTTNWAQRFPSASYLFDGQESTAANRSFLAVIEPKKVVAVGSFTQGIQDLERRLEVKVSAQITWREGFAPSSWRGLFPQETSVVICPAEPRRLLLQSACLAGALHAALCITPGDKASDSDIAVLLKQWRPDTVYLAGSGARANSNAVTRVVHLPSEGDVVDRYVQIQSAHGPIQDLLVANPADGARGLSNMSPLAPWLAVQRSAALLHTNVDGDDVDEIVEEAISDPRLHNADSLTFLGDLKAIPMQRRPNPIASGKDPYIEMEPLTPHGTAPFSFATGRLFHPDRGFVGLLLARQRALAHDPAPRKALVVGNPSGNLPLVETLSRSAARELLNGGYDTTAWHGSEVNKEDLQRLLPLQDIFLWEGHYNTLMKEYRLSEWPEPLRPSLIFLQSCLALCESKAQPLIERGAVSVVGTSTRTYSGSGGACALAFFDALLYDGQSQGASLRQAKNFLLAYALLKQKRLGHDARLTGANLRSAWAFTLWGDPTLTLPRPEAPSEALDAVRHEVRGNTIAISLPDSPHARDPTGKYQAQILPNERLAGLLTRQPGEATRHLVPLVFAEVRLPNAPPGAKPVLRSRLPSRRWVFCWDSRRNCGYLLASPRSTDRDELRFHVDWISLVPPSGARAANNSSPALRDGNDVMNDAASALDCWARFGCP
jgi:hypothetical protein